MPQTDPPSTDGAPGVPVADRPGRRHRRRYVLAAVVALKVAVVGAVLLLPSGVASSLGIAQGLVVVVALLAGGAGLLLHGHRHPRHRSGVRPGRPR